MVFVNNKGARHIGLGHGVRLNPGVTPVEDAAWTKATKNPGPALKALLEDKDEGLVIVSRTEAGAAGVTDAGATATSPGGVAMRDSTSGSTGQEPTGGGSTSAADLGAMTVEDARGIISETFDKPTLQAWKKADARKGIKDAIDSQLEILKLEEKK